MYQQFMKLKNVLAVFFGLLLLSGAGCSAFQKNATRQQSPEEKPVFADTKSEQKVQSIKDLEGNWSYAGDSVLSGVEAVSLDLEVVDDTHVKGSFSSVLNRDGISAVRIDTGSFVGKLAAKDDKHVVAVDWEGDREDEGTATLVYNRADETLTWSANIEKDDKMFTLPKKMVLVRNVVGAAPKGEVILLQQMAIAAMNVPIPFEMKATVDIYTGKFARVRVEAAKTVIDPVFVYFKKNADTWEVAMDADETWTVEDLVRKGVPSALWYLRFEKETEE